MKTILTSIIITGGIVALHALPEMAVTMLPFWLLTLMAVALIVMLTLGAFWAFSQAAKAGDH
jgi:hypothetical protein